MREHHGPSGRVSTKVKAALVALLAVFAISGLSATQATAAQQLKLSFNDSWIGVPALDALGAGSFHAIDPEDGKNLKIDLEGSLANNGNFSAPASSFDFPTQVIDAGALGDVELNILATKAITGNYNTGSGAFSADLSLKLTVAVPAMNVLCAIEPLNIPLGTTGSYDFGDTDEPNLLSAANFTSGAGAVLGSWTGVGVDNVTQVSPAIDPTLPPEEQEEQNICKMVINGLIADEGVDNPSFDGTIWLGGTAEVTGQPDPDLKPGKVGKITVAPKNTVIKKGKKKVLKVKVKNAGDKVLKTKLKIQAPKAKVNVKKQMQIKVPAGKVKVFRVPVKVKKTKKAKGQAKIVFKAGGKKAVAKVKIKK